MESLDHTYSLLVEKNQQETFNSINNVSQWWSADFEGSTDNLDDVFTVRFGDVFITSKVAELIPFSKITWQVLDCNKPWLKNTKEWIDTKMVWELTIKAEQTLIRFVHLGLVPEIECFEVCSNAWKEYLQISLRNFINSGDGKPTAKMKM